MTNVKFADKLPEMSFAYLNTTGEVIMIKRGETGYYPQAQFEGRSVDELNETIGVTKAQAEAMVSGSMFGWEVPASNPELYENFEKEGRNCYTHNRVDEGVLRANGRL